MVVDHLDIVDLKEGLFGPACVQHLSRSVGAISEKVDQLFRFEIAFFGILKRAN